MFPRVYKTEGKCGAGSPRSPLPQPLVLAPQALVCLGFWRDSEGAVYMSGWKDTAGSSARNPGNRTALLDRLLGRVKSTLHPDEME